MDNENILTGPADDSPLQLLENLCKEQSKTTLALEQLEETQKKLIGSLGNLKDSEKPENSGSTGSALATTADIAGILAAIDVFSGNIISQGAAKLAIKLATKHPLGAVIVLLTLEVVGGTAYLQQQVETGQLDLNLDEVTAQANTMDSILAASNPFIYQGENELAPGRKGGRAGRRLDEFRKKQATINQANATLNTIGDIYAASNPHLYQPTATFNAWQTNQSQPTAIFDNWQQQQTQLADIQAQTAQYWQTQSDNSKNEAVTLNVTNNFKDTPQDRKRLNEIGEYLGQQIMDNLNAGRRLYSHNW